MQYSEVQYNTAQYSTVQCSTSSTQIINNYCYMSRVVMFIHVHHSQIVLLKAAICWDVTPLSSQWFYAVADICSSAWFRGQIFCELMVLRSDRYLLLSMIQGLSSYSASLMILRSGRYLLFSMVQGPVIPRVNGSTQWQIFAPKHGSGASYSASQWFFAVADICSSAWFRGHLFCEPMILRSDKYLLFSMVSVASYSAS